MGHQTKSSSSIFFKLLFLYSAINRFFMYTTLRYLQSATQFFQKQPSVWEFFASHSHKEEQLKEFKTDLLKNTYKFDEASEVSLYQKVAFAKEKLLLTVPVTIYQAQHS